jgi:non-ribosomal peptide synthetase component F
VLGRLTGSDDLLIAVPMAARTRPETESVVGLVMNTVPIRIRLDRDSTLRDLVRSVHTATARVLAHHELPFARMVELVKPDRDPARHPLFQVMFAMEESWDVPDRGGLHWRPELIENGNAKFELELTVTDAPPGQQVRVNYNRDLFHPDTGRLVLDGFMAVQRILRDQPDLAVADAEIMSPDLLTLVTRVWPDGGPVADPDATALALLRSACAGDSVVAVGSDDTLTGDGVRELAQRITAAVRGHGVGVSDRVALLLPRGARLVPAILGIWSAGASYAADPIIAGAAGICSRFRRGRDRTTAAADAPVPPPVRRYQWWTGRSDRRANHANGAAPAPPVADRRHRPSPSRSSPRSRPAAQGGQRHPGTRHWTRGAAAFSPKDRFVAMSTFAFDIALFARAGARRVVCRGCLAGP